jgi:YHS domain-containing protein
MGKLLVAVLFVVGTGCESKTATTSSAPSSSASSVTAPTSTAAALPAGMSRVADSSQVCMVNDQFMGKPQSPTEVEGRTYYGCCAMCKEKLEKQREMRVARDPVTGEEVDKAKAVIVQDARGKVLYFASEDTLRKYRG